jgi:SAM-dependent methyltransferase
LDEYRQIWETEAADNHVRSAIATSGDDSVEALTAKLSPAYATLGRDAHFGTIVDLGCGYGRVALHLGLQLGITCDRYVGVDISEHMLEHLERYRVRFGLWPGAHVETIRASIDELPLADRTADLLVSSAVFLHMGDRYLVPALTEVARVLADDGRYVFESSFMNANNPANLPWRLAGLFRPARPNRVKFRSRRHIERLWESSGLAARSDFAIEPAAHALLPKGLVPGARRVNALVGEHRCLASTFTVRSIP